MQCTFPYPLQSNNMLNCTQSASEFTISTDSLIDYNPTIAVLNDGGFVVVWFDNNAGNIHGRMYDSTGTNPGSEFTIGTDGLIDYNPTIAVLNDGGFVVVWFDNNAGNIHGRMYDKPKGTCLNT